MPTSVHIGYDDHISGFELQNEDLENIISLDTPEEVNDYIVSFCERVEVTESDLFLNMLDNLPNAEFAEFICSCIFFKNEC